MLFLINLESAEARRTRMVRQLEALGLPYRRVGFDGRHRSHDAIEAWAEQRFPGISFMRDRLSGAEIGCWLSHMTAWQQMLAQPGQPSCTVIEDDLVLDERFGSVTAGLRAKCTFDVVFLGTSSRNLSTRNRVAVENGIYLHRPVGAVYNTWGYVITRRYGESLLQRLQQVRWPIDHVLGGRIGALRPRLAVLQPPVVQEDRELGLQSQIEPYTFRLDRLRLIEHTRRRLLDSPVGDLYSLLYELF